MECPYCGEELNYEEYYGKHNWEMGPGVTGMRDWWDKTGDIYKCKNEECDAYEQHFYTDKQDNLHEGYLC
jgi:hypothetical protein